jgi:Skp family chaperone for outer membrane proteins
MLSTLLAILIQGAAQAAPPPPAATPLGGPVVQGVCLLSRQAVFANAKVGVAASARLVQLATEAQGEVDAERAPIDKDMAAYNDAAPKMTLEQRTQRARDLEARMAPIRAKAAQRSREVEATRNTVMAKISDAAQPLIAQAYAARKCGLLFDRNSVLGGNFENDLTADVVRALDAKLTTLSFNREVLPPLATTGK